MKRLIPLFGALMFLTVQCYSQESLKIGNVGEKGLVITNQKALDSYFNNSLENSGKLGKEMKIEKSPSGDRFFVSTSVSENKNAVTAIGVMLVVKNKEAHIVSLDRANTGGDGPGVGGSMNVQCQGAPCELCLPELDWSNGQWYPLVRCVCFDPQGKCNSVISFTVNLGVGF